MAEKQQEQRQWHLDVYASATDTRWQWYTLVLGQDNAKSLTDPANKPKYKHGKAGQNYLYFDFSVRNDEPLIKYATGELAQHAPHHYRRR
jgi:hypothetical protein